MSLTIETILSSDLLGTSLAKCSGRSREVIHTEQTEICPINFSLLLEIQKKEAGWINIRCRCSLLFYFNPKTHY